MYRDKLCRPAPGSKGRLPILLVPNPDVPRDVAPATFRTAALLRRSWSLDATTLNADWATAAWKPASLLGSWPPTGRLGTSTHPALSAPRGGAGRGPWVARAWGSGAPTPKDRILDAHSRHVLAHGTLGRTWGHRGLEALTSCPCQKQLRNGIRKGKRSSSDRPGWSSGCLWRSLCWLPSEGTTSAGEAPENMEAWPASFQEQTGGSAEVGQARQLGRGPWEGK